MATQIGLNALLESIGRGIATSTRTARFGSDLFTDITGYHIYGELSLTLRLTAAEETSEAQRLLRIFQEYTLIGEACAVESEAVLLEVQGERIHFLLPADTLDANSLTKVISFAVAFTNAVYDRIGKSAGKDFQGFKMATDHGRAILLASGGQANGSVLSLGPAANAPAKELKRNGAAGHIRIKSAYYTMVAGPGNPTGWVNIPVLDPLPVVKHLISTELRAKFLNRSDEYFREALRNNPNVLFAGADYLKGFAGGYVNQAIKVRGFSLRADLDGFSREVQEAFKRGDAAILALVTRFFNIIRYPEQFRSRIGKTIDMPWAGDCATVIILPGESGYDDAREFLPVKAASEWHSQKDGTNSNKQPWAQYFGETKWAVGIAGGDDEEGSSGYILVAPLAGRHRDFLVAAGWSVGRSLDAQEADGVTGDNTVIPVVDYRALASTHRTNFRELNSNFWISRGLKAASLRSSGTSELLKKTPIYVPHISEPVPNPRPWAPR